MSKNKEIRPCYQLREIDTFLSSETLHILNKMMIYLLSSYDGSLRHKDVLLQSDKTCFSFVELVDLTYECVYVGIGNPGFRLFLYLTVVRFRGKLQHGSDVSQQKSSVDQSELKK